MPPTKDALLALGQERVRAWCDLNDVPRPIVIVYPDGRPPFSACAYYRKSRIHIWPRACAHVGVAGRAWSAPGYSVDRTPFGVLAHELAHHVDDAAGARGGTLSHAWRRETAEAPLTSYCPDSNEWFAEMFRLFVTNPLLLAALRPRTFKLMDARWRSVERRPWAEVLAPYPRQLAVATKRAR
jgi:hypothetical protein